MQESNTTILEDKIKTTGKMKISGYICLGVAFVLSVVKIFISDSGIDIQIIEHWTNTGLYLLFGNAIKHNVRNGINAMQNRGDGVR